MIGSIRCKISGLGVILLLIAYLLAHWIDLWAWPPVLEWKATARLTLEKLLPSVLWTGLLKQIKRNASIAARWWVDLPRRADVLVLQGRVA